MIMCSWNTKRENLRGSVGLEACAQSCLTLCNCSPPGPRNSPVKNTGVGCHAFIQGVIPRNRTWASCISRKILYHLRVKGSLGVILL